MATDPEAYWNEVHWDFSRPPEPGDDALNERLLRHRQAQVLIATPLFEFRAHETDAGGLEA